VEEELLKPGERHDYHKVFLGCLKPGTVQGHLNVLLRDVARLPDTYQIIWLSSKHNENVRAAFVVFRDPDDAQHCIGELSGQEVPIVSPSGKTIRAHRGELQAFKRAGL